jgi:Flp pilus assembly protein TadG
MLELFTMTSAMRTTRRGHSSHSRRSARSRLGATTVEMAITSGLAFFFFFASLEFCRVSMIRHAVEHALYEGARKGIIPGATATEVQRETQAVLSTVGITGASIDVTPATIVRDTKELQVRVRLPLDRGLFAPALFFVGKSLDRTLTMQREGVQ